MKDNYLRKRRSKMKKRFLYFKVLLSTPLVGVTLVGSPLVGFMNMAFAHSGGLDKNGCHYMQAELDESLIFHCHKSQSVADYYTQKNTGKLGWYSGEVLEVIDGDTLKVRVPIWLGQWVETNVRLRGIDTPELKHSACAAERKKAIASRQALIEFVGKEVILHDVAYDKFGGRVIADVYNNSLANIGVLLVETNHARFYDGKSPRQNWC